MSLRSFLNPLKDHAIEAAVTFWFNHTQGHLGTLTKIHLNSEAKWIDLELDLRGEVVPVVVLIKSYTLTSEGRETFIELGEIETSREWVNALLARVPAAQRKFQVPGAVKALL